MPFADPAGVIAGAFEELREDGFGEGQAFVVVERVVDGVVIVAEACLVATGEQAGARG